MNGDELRDWIKAGEIAKEAREFGKKICKENMLHLDIAEKIENKIREIGGRPAFPVDVSINNIAAHATPMIGDKSVLTKGDLVKLDIGVHVNGCISDTAVTVEINSEKYSKLVKASEEALEEALKIVKAGIAVREIGRVIQQTITKNGFSPVRNLSGHGLELYEVHVNPTIPNYDNGDNTKLEVGQKIAIEPFATTGNGQVKDGKPAGIYALIEKKPTRVDSARKVLGYIEKEFKTLPFALRWIKIPNAAFALKILERDGIIKQYTVLPEVSNGIVSQAEHTVIVEKDGCRVLT